MEYKMINPKYAKPKKNTVQMKQRETKTADSNSRILGIPLNISEKKDCGTGWKIKSTLCSYKIQLGYKKVECNMKKIHVKTN